MPRKVSIARRLGVGKRWIRPHSPPMDPTARALLEQTADLGYRVTLARHGDGYQAEAVSDVNQYVIRGADVYECACELAERVGIDLADGGGENFPRP